MEIQPRGLASLYLFDAETVFTIGDLGLIKRQYEESGNVAVWDGDRRGFSPSVYQIDPIEERGSIDSKQNGVLSVFSILSDKVRNARLPR
jgi:hypothetical protein